MRMHSSWIQWRWPQYQHQLVPPLPLNRLQAAAGVTHVVGLTTWSSTSLQVFSTSSYISAFLLSWDRAVNYFSLNMCVLRRNYREQFCSLHYVYTGAATTKTVDDVQLAVYSSLKDNIFVCASSIADFSSRPDCICLFLEVPVSANVK